MPNVNKVALNVNLLITNDHGGYGSLCLAASTLHPLSYSSSTVHTYAQKGTDKHADGRIGNRLEVFLVHKPFGNVYLNVYICKKLMTTTTLRQLRSNMKKYFDRIENDKDVLLVPRQGGKEAIVIMTLSEYNSMAETDYLMSTSANRKVIEKAIGELEKGDVIEFDENLL